MARKKNPISDIVDAAGAWLGGNRGSVPSSGAGAAWQASARSAAQSSNRRIVKGVEEGVVQFGALGMGTSAQTQRDLMYGVSGAGTQALKEAAVSQVTGLAAGAVAAKVGSKVAGKIASALDNRTVMLAHGGAKDLVGGRVSPSFSREVQKQLDSTTIRNLRWSIDAKNPARVTSSEETRKIQKFLKSAEKSGGFFSASATGETPAAYAVPRVSYRGKNLAGSAKSGGAVHVVKVPKKSVIRGGGESGEFLVAANPKPVKSFEFPKTYSTPGQAIEDLASQVDAFIKSKNRLKVPKRK